MKITFKSLVKQPEAEDIKVEYPVESEYELYEDDKQNKYHAFSFRDNDKAKTKTRIEIHEKYVNIFRDASSLFFELGKQRNDSTLDLGNGMTFPIITELEKVEIDDHHKKVHYKLLSINNDLISECLIDIKHE